MKKLKILLAMYMALTLFCVSVHATDASGEAEVGFDVGVDDLYRLNVQVIGYGFVRDGSQMIRSSVTYEVPTGITKEFVFVPDTGYRIKKVSYEKVAEDDIEPEEYSRLKENMETYEKTGIKEHTDLKETTEIDLTANLRNNKIEIPTISADMKLLVLYEKLPVKAGNISGTMHKKSETIKSPYSVDTGDRTMTYPYLILMLAAFLIITNRKRRRAEEI